MARDDDDGLTAKPGQDPYELEWPDDAKDARAAEREKAAREAEITPVSWNLAAIIIGVGLTLLCILPVAAIGGATGLFVAVTAPVIIAGVVIAFPTGWVLERATRGMPRGVAEVAFLIVGGAIGYGLTWGGLTALSEQLFENPQDLEVVRSQTSIFMMTATAVGFVAAHMLADKLRRYPKQVKILGLLLVVLFVLSVVANFFIRPA